MLAAHSHSPVVEVLQEINQSTSPDGHSQHLATVALVPSSDVMMHSRTEAYIYIYICWTLIYTKVYIEV